MRYKKVICDCSENILPHIHTLEGLMVPNVGDWIIRGVNGEFYSCRAEIFEKTYRIVKAKGERP